MQILVKLRVMRSYRTTPVCFRYLSPPDRDCPNLGVWLWLEYLLQQELSRPGQKASSVSFICFRLEAAGARVNV